MQSCQHRSRVAEAARAHLHVCVHACVRARDAGCVGYGAAGRKGHRKRLLGVAQAGMQRHRMAQGYGIPGYEGVDRGLFQTTAFAAPWGRRGRCAWTGGGGGGGLLRSLSRAFLRDRRLCAVTLSSSSDSVHRHGDRHACRHAYRHAVCRRHTNTLKGSHHGDANKSWLHVWAC